MNSMIAGSISPERVPITSPSSGVRPIDVSTHLPFNTALMKLRFQGGYDNLEFFSPVPRSLLPLFDTKLWLVPWKPYLLTLYFS